MVEREVQAVGGIVRDNRGWLLLIKRGNEPDRGSWSLPGGRVEPGETSEDAVVRELLEETGLKVTVVQLAGQVRRPHADGGQYVIHDFIVDVIAGELHAGDDALEARWFDPGQVRALDLSPGLLGSLTTWRIL